MISLSAATGRLQISRAQCTRQPKPSAASSARCIALARLQLVPQRRIVAVAAEGGGDDKSAPETPSDMTSSLKEQQTGKMSGGPADTQAGRDVESSDTNPAMDPSEQSTMADREGSGTDKTDMSGQKSDKSEKREGGQAAEPQGSQNPSGGEGSGQGSGAGGSGMQGFPEGSLRVGGEDAQAAESVDADSNAVITGDSVAARIEQVYGVGPEASQSAAEANTYQAEAGGEGGMQQQEAPDKGQSA